MMEERVSVLFGILHFRNLVIFRRYCLKGDIIGDLNGL